MQRAQQCHGKLVLQDASNLLSIASWIASTVSLFPKMRIISDIYKVPGSRNCLWSPSILPKSLNIFSADAEDVCAARTARAMVLNGNGASSASQSPPFRIKMPSLDLFDLISPIDLTSFCEKDKTQQSDLSLVQQAIHPALMPLKWLHHT